VLPLLKKNFKNLTFSGLTANGLEFKLGAQLGMALHVVTIFSIMAAKTQIFIQIFSQKR